MSELQRRTDAARVWLAVVMGMQDMTVVLTELANVQMPSNAAFLAERRRRERRAGGEDEGFIANPDPIRTDAARSLRLLRPVVRALLTAAATTPGSMDFVFR